MQALGVMPIVIERDLEWWDRCGVTWEDFQKELDAIEYRIDKKWFDDSNMLLLPR